jgi:glycosyltransferase involved in cell wall biosynthesis
LQVLPLRNALDVQSANRLARFVINTGAEIVHAHMARDYPLSAFATRKSTAKLILTRHVLFPLNRFQNLVFPRAAQVIAVSEAVARQLEAQKLLPPNRIKVVRNGIEVEQFIKARRLSDPVSLRRSWGFPDDCLVVGTVGELNPLKGHDILMRAAAEVVSSNPQSRFVIVGGDPSREAATLRRLERLASDLNLTDQIRLLGQVDEVAPLLAAMDLFVSASQTESFGLAIVEALASGLPVVATETEGAGEIIELNETGFLVPVGQPAALAKAINRLVSDGDLRLRMGQAAYRAASERFQLDKMVDSIEKIYEKSVRGEE